LGSNEEWNYYLISQEIENPENFILKDWKQFTLNCRDYLVRLLNDVKAEDMKEFDLSDPELQI